MDSEDYKALREQAQEEKAEKRNVNAELLDFLCGEMELECKKLSDYHYRIYDGEFKLYLDYHPTKSTPRAEGSNRYYPVADLERTLKTHFNK